MEGRDLKAEVHSLMLMYFAKNVHDVGFGYQIYMDDDFERERIHQNALFGFRCYGEWCRHFDEDEAGELESALRKIGCRLKTLERSDPSSCLMCVSKAR